MKESEKEMRPRMYAHERRMKGHDVIGVYPRLSAAGNVAAAKNVAARN